MSQLSCKKLCLGYDGHEIVHNLNFSIEKGDYFCIVGENGSGKSTLMKTILGLQPPVHGEVKIDDSLKKSGIGYLPQQTMVQRDFPASVWEIVLSGCQNKGGLHLFYTKDDKKLAMDNIERMGLNDYIKRCYRELSGGQQQRVLLARALCAASDILLLDEPVSGLDPKVTEELYRLIEDINKNDKITVIMISHDIGAALKYADKILHIGGNTFFGTKEEYLNSDIFKSFGLGEDVCLN